LQPGIHRTLRLVRKGPAKKTRCDWPTKGATIERFSTKLSTVIKVEIVFGLTGHRFSRARLWTAQPAKFFNFRRQRAKRTLRRGIGGWLGWIVKIFTTAGDL